MNNMIHIGKKIVLFLAGVALIIWGYKVNAANVENNKLKDIKTSDSQNSADEPKKKPEKQEKTNEESESQKPKVKVLSKDDVIKTEGQNKSTEPQKQAKNKSKAESNKEKNTHQTTIEPDKTEESSGTN